MKMFKRFERGGKGEKEEIITEISFLLNAYFNSDETIPKSYRCFLKKLTV
jgi:hypothetical protein